jgi:hypothetical protein
MKSLVVNAFVEMNRSKPKDSHQCEKEEEKNKDLQPHRMDEWMEKGLRKKKIEKKFICPRGV